MKYDAVNFGIGYTKSDIRYDSISPRSLEDKWRRRVIPSDGFAVGEIDGGWKATRIIISSMHNGCGMNREIASSALILCET